MLLSPHYSEIIKGSIMTCDGIVVMYGGGVFQMLFKPFTKGSGWFSYVLILTLQPITLVSVDDATFLSNLDLCPWVPSGVHMAITSATYHTLALTSAKKSKPWQ